MPRIRSCFSVVVVSLMIAACAVCSACAREKHAMPTDAVDARIVFSDPRVAELAEAVADGDILRIRDLAAGVDVEIKLQ